MSLRMIEIIIPADKKDEIVADFKELAGEDSPAWVDHLDNGHLSVKTIMEMDKLETVTDHIEKKFHLGGDYRILVWELAATIPRLKKEEKEEEKEEKEKENTSRNRISREELYAKVNDMTGITKSQIVLILVSSVVAAIGLLRNSQIVTMSAMVIAPLLGPHVALALSATLGELDLAKRSAISAATGIGVSFALAVLLGLVINVDPSINEIAARTNVGLNDIGLALAAGVAGTLSITMGVSSALVGVMVALALLPPLVAAGLLMGSGKEALGFQALILFGVNVISLNLAGVLTFLFQGIRPISWWKAREAKRTTYKVLIGWAILLLALIAGFFILTRYGIFSPEGR